MDVLGLKKQRLEIIEALLRELEDERLRIHARMDGLRDERSRLREHVAALEVEHRAGR